MKPHKKHSLRRKQTAVINDHLPSSSAPHAETGTTVLEKESGRHPSSDIAVIGMACMFPKAGDLPTYWNNILNRVNTIEEIPAKRWNWELYYDEDRGAKDKVNSKWGGFIPDVHFDPLEFGMPPNSLTSIEPLQLLLLICVRSALKDSGYLNRSFDRSRTSVIIGAGGDSELAQSYGFRSALPAFFGQSAEKVLSNLDGVVPSWNEDTLPGVLPNVAAGRVANRFDLGGSNYSLDAACASSLAALRAGCLELKSRESDLVVVGGADTIMNPYAYTCFSKTATLSPSGRSRPFDADADGIVLSEGVAAILIKRLEDARRDGDKIYAVIKGVASSSDGKAKGLAAPRPEGQVLALRRAYEQAAVPPETVGLIEAHATGTGVGDRVECEALNRVFTDAKMEPKRCAVGSIKSMIGHPKRVAGLAGLIKTALALHHKVLPPTIGVENPVREAASPESPLYVNAEVKPWIECGQHPRRAGVSSFGFGGTNFHAVLEEYVEPSGRGTWEPALKDWPSELVILRGTSRDALRKRVEELLGTLRGKGSIPLKDLAYHLSGPQKGEGNRCLAIVCGSRADLEQKLETARADLGDPKKKSIWSREGIYYRDEPRNETGKIAFVYPGQGSQYCGMLAELAIQYPVVRSTLQSFSETLMERLGKPLSRIMYPPFGFSRDEIEAQEKELMQSNVAQAAMGAADLAMHKLLRDFGVQPDVMAGHSYGEYVALHAAGVFSQEALALLSEARGRYILEAAGRRPGTMAAVRGGEEDVRKAIEKLGNLWVANLNAPDQTVISGSEDSVKEAIGTLKEEGLSAVRIPTSCAFHSPMVSGAQKKLGRFIREIPFDELTHTLFSNTTAGPYPKDKEGIANLLVRHIVEPVNFIKEIEALHESGVRIFVEVGAGNVLTKLIGKILGSKPHTAVCTDAKGVSSLDRLQHALAQLTADGVDTDLDLLYRGRGCRDILEHEFGPDPAREEPSRAAWIINGGRAVPASTKQGNGFVPRPIGFLDEVGLRDESPEKVVDGENERFQKEDGTAMVRQPGEESGRNPILQEEGDDSVIMEFQKLMHKFLDTQKSVMLAYLHGQGSELPLQPQAQFRAPVAEARPSAQAEQRTRPSEEAVPFAPVLEPPESAPAAETALQQPAPATDRAPAEDAVDTLSEIEAKVLEIVEERTGYPQEVLDLDLDLEADLGLDSIKKVEILGALREYIEEQTGGRMQVDPEEASRVTTLRGIIELVTQEVGTGSPARSGQNEATSVGREGPQGGDTVPTEEISEIILSLVEERTGYPKEVLDLDLDLEADLGLDSIKKVEILGALREQFEQRLGRPMEMEAEEAARITTLRGIIHMVARETETGAAGEVPVEAVPGVAQDEPQGREGMLNEEISEIVLSLVEERTGYPKEVLDLDLDLEADLGLDSIKKVEILGALREQFEQRLGRPMEMEAEEAARITTLRGIINMVCQEVRPAPAEEPRDASVPEDAGELAGTEPQPLALDPESSEIKRFVLVTEERPLVPGRSLHFEDKPVIIVCSPEDRIADHVARELRGRQASVLKLHDGKTAQRKDADAYEADLTSPQSVADIVELIRTEKGPVGGLVHLVPLCGGKSFEEMALSDWRERLARDVKSLFYLTRFCAKDMDEASKTGGASVVAVTGMGGAFASEGVSDSGYATFPGQGGVTGFLKALSEEWPEVNIRSLDVDLGETPEILGDHVVSEFMHSSGEVEVGYRDAKRRVISLKEASTLGEDPGENLIDSSSVVLITGGARGITSTVALELAERFRPTIILAGRSEEPAPEEPEQTRNVDDTKQLKSVLLKTLSEGGKSVKPREIERAYRKIVREREMRGNMKRMRDLGAQVTYLQADVQDESALEVLIGRIYEEHGRIDGVVHGAGVIEDKLVRDKDPGSFDRVFDTKADSLFLLSRKIKPETLRFFTLFSSVAGRFGNRGQADYGAVNEVYNKTAIHLDKIWPARVVSFLWGPWESTGMVSEEVQRQFRERGICVIPRSLGPKLFVRELLSGKKGEVEVVFGNREGMETEVATRAGAEIPFPLLSNKTFVSPHSNGHLELIRSFDPSRDVYLEHHKLDGRPVVPMAVALEMMAEAVSYGWPDFPLKSIKEMQVFKGIVVRDGRQDIRIVAKPREQTSEHLTLDVRLVGTQQDPVVYYRALAECSRTRKSSNGHKAITIQEALPFHLTTQQAYQQWLFHGPIFQGIRNIETFGKDGVVATLKSSFPTSFVKGVHEKLSWIIDPLVIDSGLQLLVLWMRSIFDRTPLPSRFSNYERVSESLPDGDLRCEVRTHPKNGNGIITADLFFVLPDGNLYGILEGMEIVGSKSFNRLAMER